MLPPVLAEICTHLKIGRNIDYRLDEGPDGESVRVIASKRQSIVARGVAFDKGHANDSPRMDLVHGGEMPCQSNRRCRSLPTLTHSRTRGSTAPNATSCSTLFSSPSAPCSVARTILLAWRNSAKPKHDWLKKFLELP